MIKNFIYSLFETSLKALPMLLGAFVWIIISLLFNWSIFLGAYKEYIVIVITLIICTPICGFTLYIYLSGEYSRLNYQNLNLYKERNEKDETIKSLKKEIDRLENLVSSTRTNEIIAIRNEDKLRKENIELQRKELENIKTIRELNKIIDEDTRKIKQIEEEIFTLNRKQMIDNFQVTPIR